MESSASEEFFEICWINLILSLYRFFSIPEHILPEIKSSSTIFGHINNGALQGIPVGAVGELDLIPQRIVNSISGPW